VIASDAIDQAMTMARHRMEEAKAALGGFDETPYSTALLDLADFTVDRRF
jgi:geranylgeranyl pyrophosphate synthase